MSAGNFEIHLTLLPVDEAVAARIARTLHWKTSKIDGDPQLGAKVFCYLTTHRGTMLDALSAMTGCADELRQAGCTVVREKIEQILHDQRFQ